MRMPVLTMAGPDYDVVLGPCPGCEAWQLDYTYAVAASFSEPIFEELYEFGSAEPVAAVQEWDRAGFHEIVEFLLEEHLEECPHLQLVLAHGY